MSNQDFVGLDYKFKLGFGKLKRGTRIKGVVCSNNYDPEKERTRIAKIQCHEKMQNNNLFDGAYNTNFRLHCPPGCLSNKEPGMRVIGTSIFRDDSSICLAAIHNGIIKNESGGYLIVGSDTGRKEYLGLENNGVTSEAWKGE